MNKPRVSDFNIPIKYEKQFQKNFPNDTIHEVHLKNDEPNLSY